MEIEESRCGAKVFVTKIAVGPSAPPIIPIDDASWGVNPNNNAPKKVIKIPIWAAAPKIMLFGLEINGPKSVVAPMPKKIRHG